MGKSNIYSNIFSNKYVLEILILNKCLGKQTKKNGSEKIVRREQLIWGDCLEEMKKIPIKNIIIVTDPPFNIGYKYNKYNDKKPEEEYYKWLIQIMTILNCPFVLIHYPEALYKFTEISHYIPQKVISWVYNSNTQKQHRDIAFYGIKPNFAQIKQPYKNLNDKRIQKRIAEGKIGAKLYDWWEINQVKNVSKEKTEHPCQMPLEVMRRIIGILPEEYIILDPFMGSGTTGVACKELGREFIGIEIDEKYFNIAIERLGL